MPWVQTLDDHLMTRLRAGEGVIRLFPLRTLLVVSLEAPFPGKRQLRLRLPDSFRSLRGQCAGCRETCEAFSGRGQESWLEIENLVRVTAGPLM